MNKFMFSLIIILNFIFIGCGKNESVGIIKQELEKITFQLDEAWNKGDAIAFAQLWTESATNISPMGDIDEGRETIEKNMMVQFSGSMKGTTHKLIIERFYMVSSTVAMVDGTAEVAMNNYEPWKSKFTAIFLNEKDGLWKIAHMRAYVFLK